MVAKTFENRWGKWLWLQILHPNEVYLRKPDESLRDAAKRLGNARLLSDLLTNPMEEKEKAT